MATTGTTAKSAGSAQGKSSGARRRSLANHLTAGGIAGLAEALACHPLDTVKVRMQLRASGTPGRLPSTAAVTRPSFLRVGQQIVEREGAMALYKGLGAVAFGIVPKMAIRFSSFGFYESNLRAHAPGYLPIPMIAGLAAGVTEAVLVVTPMDVVKIALQAQTHSLRDPLDVPRYRSPLHALYTIAREQGVRAVYRGVSLTALRQATNQAANFSAYHYLKSQLENHRQEAPRALRPWEHTLLGAVAGALGPICNNPIDTVKTRIQRAPLTFVTSKTDPTKKVVEPGWRRMKRVISTTIEREGYAAFYRGLTPRLLRVAPGNAVSFTVYEYMSKQFSRIKITIEDPLADQQI